MRVARASRLPGALARAASEQLTYPEHGASAGPLPVGYHHLHHRVLLGHGTEVLEAAEAALRSWRAQSGAGLAVAAEGPVETGRTVVLGLGRPLSLVIPCRVVWTVYEENRRGFGYGTLPGHPVRGEECFVLERDPGGAVWLAIAAFSRPGSALIRALGPVGRAFQRCYVRRYAAAIRRSVS